MFNKPNPRPNFSQIDEEITTWWKEKDIFKKSIEIREDADEFIFYDGPPFMSGMPHYATLLSSLPKDAIPRFQTMKGKKVERLWGWDCHGLPIENIVEKELNITDRKEIEENLEQFIEKCYEWNRVGIENWRWYIDKIGRWADLDNAYRTMDQSYMESIWWVFKQMWEKGFVYKGLRTSLFSTDSSTPVSSFEVSMDSDNYRETQDIAVTVKFKVTDTPAAELEDITKPMYLLAWTTTPWTLPSNFALAVNRKEKYVAIEYNQEVYILAKDLVESVFSNNNPEEFTILKEFKGEILDATKYEQLYDFLEKGGNDCKVYLSEYVTIEDGTGVLHVAPAFGEADFEMGKQFNLSFTSDIDESGNLTVGPWKGMYLRDANKEITNDLESSAKLFKREDYVHRLPYYRYENPLIYKTQENYFVDVQKLKKQLLESNNDINWIPKHFGDKRFKHIIDTAPDWSISRSRFWGTPMPLWETTDGEQMIVGSRDELMSLVNQSKHSMKIRKILLSIDESDDRTENELHDEIVDLLQSDKVETEIKTSQKNCSLLRAHYFGETTQEANVKPIEKNEKRAFYLLNDKALDLHRPYIDDVSFIINGKEYKRVKETLDVWMDSGSMPFAQFHYPFVKKETFEKSFPGDFISEYTGQIRAWFYVLHVIANAVFEKPAYKNVLVTGVLSGTDGRKMSKSFGNYPDPKETLEKYGSEALRLYFLGSPLMDGKDMDFNESDLKMQIREYLLPLWNIYKYLATYVNIHEWEPKEELALNKRNVTDDDHPWDHIPFDDVINPLDEWILHRLQNTINEVTESFENFEMPKGIRTIRALIDDTSKWYIRSSRDRFTNGEERALETLYYVVVEICKLFAPVAPFITESIYQELVGSILDTAPESVHLCDYPEVDKRFLQEYSATEYEMNFVRKITEMGHTIRANNQLKVRQPLQVLEIENRNQTVTAISEWMEAIIREELNVKEVTEVITLTEKESILVEDDINLAVKVGLESELTSELVQEGLLRELTRNIQAQRKKQKFFIGDMILIEYFTEDEDIKALLQERKEDVKKAVNANSIVETMDIKDQENTFFSNLNGKQLQFRLTKSNT